MDKVVEYVRTWRDELLNLSRRDRVLYYKPTKAASLLIREPSAVVLLDALRRGGLGWSFFYPPDESEFEDDEVRVRRPDELLTHKSTGRELDIALRNLERRTTQEYMDKGIWVLYLAVGFLHWVDPDSKESVRTPILLIPISLERSGVREPARVRMADEDPLLNPALVVKMGSDFGLTFPEMPDLDDLDLGEYFASVEDAIADQGWAVAAELAIDVFSFHKEVMYRDLKENEEMICENEIIRALALGDQADVDLSFEPPSEDDLDQIHPPEQLVTVRDADASQRRCIVASRSGKSFVMDGPPGTGKSQTIANIISQALVDGKSVLFVSEKIAALEVVKARLDEVGLGEYLLELHSHKTTRRHVAETLYRSLTRQPRSSQVLSEQDLAKLASRRELLSKYAAAMNEVRQPLGLSLHQAIGRVASLHDLAAAPISTLDPGSLDAATLDQISTIAGSLSRAWGPVERGDDFVWRGISDEVVGLAGQRQALDRVKNAQLALANLKACMDDLASELELWWNDAPRRAEPLSEVVELLGERTVVPSGWLTIENLEMVVDRVEALRHASSAHHDHRARLESLVASDWRGVDKRAHEKMVTLRDGLSQGLVPWPLTENASLVQLRDARVFAEGSVLDLRRVLELVRLIGAKLGLVASDLTIARCGSIAELTGLVGLTHAPEEAWLEKVNHQRAREAASVLGSVVQRYREKADKLKELYKPSVLDLDLHELKVRFDTLHKGLRKLGSEYRADKKLLAQHTFTGKASKAAIAALGDVIEWKEILGDLHVAEQEYASRLGSHYYRGIDTRFEVVEEALHTAERVLDLTASLVSDPRRLRSNVARGDDWDPTVKEAGDELKRLMTGWSERAATVLGVAADSLGQLPIEDVLASVLEDVPRLAELCELADSVEGIARVPLTFGQIVEVAHSRAVIDEIETSIAETFEADQMLLGPAYLGVGTEWGSVVEGLAWASSLRAILDGPVANETAERLLVADPEAERLETARKSWVGARDALADLFVGDRRRELIADLDSHFGDAQSILARMTETLEEIEEWHVHNRARNELAEYGLAGATEHCISSRVPRYQVASMMEKATLETWIDSVLESDERLRPDRSDDREALVEEFRSLDRDLVTKASHRVINEVNSRRPQTLMGVATVIHKEGQKKSRHMPVRDLLKRTAPVTLAIKPCFMMSPLSVSQFLTPDMRFDLVIFDEASQLRPSDAVNCIYRGDQLIVAGDEKQLPPTDFFQKVSMDGDDEYEEDQIDEFESVLHLAKSGGMLALPLRWHYRSQHESLITFSNYSFYEGNLITFPGALQDAHDVGIELFHVPGIYRRGGGRDNFVEAEKVAERVLFHVRNHSHLSLGVVAFSEAQASTIEYVLDQKRIQHPELDGLFSEDRLHGFFVKNLENVQGDERDIMIFSIGYGPDEYGKVTMNFGPLNRPGGWRRLNVAVTRARRRVEVITSILPEQFQDTTNSSVLHLKRYLDFARRGINALAIELPEGSGDAESPFEEEVIRVIRSLGYDAIPQVGVAHYRVDVGVKDPRNPGSFILGVECDGAAYHSSKVARDRDRLRQEVLEGLGWRLHRIWGTAWYRNRRAEEEHLQEAIEAALRGDGVARASRVIDRPPVDIDEVALPGLDEPPIWAEPYRVHVPRVGTRREFADPAAKSQIAKAIEEVVAAEGPVSPEVVLERLKESWGIARSGARIRDAFEAALATARRRSVKRDRKGFLWPSGAETTVVVRHPTDDPRSKRDERDVSDEELTAAILRTVSDALQVSWNEMTKAVAKVFGWDRRGPSIQRRFDHLIPKLVEDGLLVHEAGGLRPGRGTA